MDKLRDEENHIYIYCSYTYYDCYGVMKISTGYWTVLFCRIARWNGVLNHGWMLIKVEVPSWENEGKWDILSGWFSTFFFPGIVLKRWQPHPGLAEGGVPQGISSQHCRKNSPGSQKWMVITLLVGALEHELYDFPYIGKNDPNWLIFFRGVETTNQVMGLSENMVHEKP